MTARRWIHAGASLLGFILGYVLWSALYSNFVESVSPDVIEVLRTSQPYGIMLGVSAAFIVVGTGLVCGSIANAVSGQFERGRAKAQPHVTK